MTNRKGYKKLSSGGAGAHGTDYQIKLLMLFLLEAYQNGEQFWLSTENETGGKFDDVILETNKMSILVQAKHKKDPNVKKNLITYHDIFPVNKSKGEFSLHKYLSSFHSNIKNNFKNVNGLILCTNTCFDEKDSISNYIVPKKMDDEHIFSFSDTKEYFGFNQHCKMLLASENSNFSEQEIESFLEKLQLVSIDDHTIDERIETLIRNTGLFEALIDVESSINFLKLKVKTWFMYEKGEYLTPQDVEIFRNQYYIKELEKLNVLFKPPICAFTSQYSMYVIQKRDHADLHFLKIYQHLGTKNVIIADPRDILNTQTKLISAFELPGFVYLIISVFDETYGGLRTTINDIVNKTSDSSYKKIIFVTNKEDIVEKLSNILKIKIKPQLEQITYESFSTITQDQISSSVINFQGKDILLTDIIFPQLDTLNTVLDESIIYKLIKKESIVINSFKNNTINFYISRSICWKSENTKTISENITSDNTKESLSEEELCDIIAEDTKIKTILITDVPGMGKTMLLSNLQRMLISKYNYWVTKIHLNEYTNTLKDCINNNKSSITLEDLFTFDEILDDFERNLFNLPKKVIVMLDAVDEISPNYSSLVLDLIKSCERLENIRKVVVTSRPHCENEIVESANTVVFSLAPLSKEDQERFLCDYFTAILELTPECITKCGDYVRKLILKLADTIRESWSLIGIPLQSHMIAEIFKNDCFNYVTSNSFVTDPLENLNVADIYERFIKEKKNIYTDGKSNAAGNIIVENTLSKEFHRSIQEHTRMALQIIFDESDYKYFKILQLYESCNLTYDSESEESLIKIGILQKNGTSLQFIHRTFAEYLAAKYICDAVLNESEVEETFLNFLIGEIFSNNKYFMLHSFMNCILDSQKIPKKVLQMCGTITEKINWKYKQGIIFLGRNRHYNLLIMMLQQCNNCEGILQLQEMLDTVHRMSKIQRYTSCYIQHDLMSHVLSDFSLFKLLMEKGANIFKIYSDSITVLHLAVQQNSYDVVNYLIKKELNINVQDRKGNTPLHYAAANNIVSSVKILIDNKVNINIRNNYSQSPLHLAAEYNSVDVLSTLIEAGLSINDRDQEHYTPLLTACLNKSYFCIKYFIEKGADISAVVHNGCNFLHILATDTFQIDADVVETIKQVIEKKYINVNSVCVQGMTALHYAVRANNLRMTKLLVEAGADKEIKNSQSMTPLLVACFKKALDCALYLTDKGANTTLTDSIGLNALHYLTKFTMHLFNFKSRNLYTEMVQKIFEAYGNNVDSVCNRGMTALHYAVHAANFTMTKLLIEAGADKEIKNNEGATPLLVACFRSSITCAEYLMENGADISAIDSENCNALIYFSKTRNFGRLNETIVGKLLKANNVNSVCNQGLTALHYAAMKKNLQLTKYLVANGTNKEIRDKEGKTPLLVACSNQAFYCAEYLIFNGADVMAKDNEGDNALNYSADFKRSWGPAKYKEFKKKFRKRRYRLFCLGGKY